MILSNLKNLSFRSIAYISLILFVLISVKVGATHLIIPMDEVQKNHLKSYGIAFYALESKLEVNWLLNYRGGSFALKLNDDILKECKVRGVSFEIIADVQYNKIVGDITKPEINQDVMKLEKAPKIAVYSPKNKQPWDDAVTLVMTYAEIPYDVVYDEEILREGLSKFDWLHLHHEDFTGQYGKFWSSYKNAAWFQEYVRFNEGLAGKLGFNKVSDLKLAVALKIKNFVSQGGFMFAMCAATDSYDIALAAQNVDICKSMFDGDPNDPSMQSKLDYLNGFAFKNYVLVDNPHEYEFSSIDATKDHYKLFQAKGIQGDVFTLFDFSAKWDPVPTMLCQNHTSVVKGFMGQTTAFRKDNLRSDVLVMGETKAINSARYIHGDYGKGTWTFYGGHDPEDHTHRVSDPPTDLNLYPNSPGYRLILNNVLFPAAKKKQRKT
ncbi:MAG: asparagine synthetase B [Flavobacteriales bacterium]|nr:asparagine synthetase B [Flavobacteriales bacterium]|tara:strand:+ start:262 stop:1569 length:1308 start_codon:yes stop_codon:yes gene_type:complete